MSFSALLGCSIEVVAGIHRVQHAKVDKVSRRREVDPPKLRFILDFGKAHVDVEISEEVIEEV